MNSSKNNLPVAVVKEMNGGALVRVPQPDAASDNRDDIYAALPLEQWGNDLTELSLYFPCMKELFLNVHPKKKPAIFFSSAAMLGTLMTRTWYRYWYSPQTISRLNYSIFIIGHPGAGKNAIERLYRKLCEPMIKADKEMIDEVNRYKESRTERSTSTKAQKGDALKRPNVGIRIHPARTSTAEFIRHMTAAVEQVLGQSINLHMFSFDSELDNATQQNKGGDYKNREAMELKAFHNEEDGSMYSNMESVTGMFRVYWNYVYTGTPLSLHKKVNQANFGSGLSTRLAVIPMPYTGMALRYQEVSVDGDDVLKTWIYRLDKTQGELPIEPLNDEVYKWQTTHTEVAEYNHDQADGMLINRVPYYDINVSLPFIVMRHWDEWQERKTLTMDDTDRRLCRLVMDIQYKCQHYFFGEMARNYFESQDRESTQRRRVNRYRENYLKLPDEFGHKQFEECFVVSKSTANRSINRLMDDGVIERIHQGVYKKLLPELP